MAENTFSLMSPMPQKKCMEEIFGRRGRQSMPSVVHIVVSSGMSFARTGVGSGFVITEDGFIVTNNHVVTSGSQYAGRNNAYKVSFADGSTYEADLYARDPKSDIAITWKIQKCLQ